MNTASNLGIKPQSINFWEPLNPTELCIQPKLEETPGTTSIFLSTREFKSCHDFLSILWTTTVFFTELKLLIKGNGTKEFAEYYGQRTVLVWIQSNVWAFVERQLQSMTLAFESLEETAISVWMNYPITFLDNLYQPLPPRVEQCLLNKGYPKKYIKV